MCRIDLGLCVFLFRLFLSEFLFCFDGQERIKRSVITSRFISCIDKQALCSTVCGCMLACFANAESIVACDEARARLLNEPVIVFPVLWMLRALVGDERPCELRFFLLLRSIWSVSLWWFGKQRRVFFGASVVAVSGRVGACGCRGYFRYLTTVSFTCLCEALRKGRTRCDLVMRTNTRKGQTFLCSVLFVSFPVPHPFGVVGLCGNTTRLCFYSSARSSRTVLEPDESCAACASVDSCASLESSET